MSSAVIPHGLRVLVVDDELDFVETVTKRLTKRGVLCEGAHSGREAFMAILARDFDVVLLDVRLGEVSGNELLFMIKKERPHIAVVMISGHASQALGSEGLSIGAADYLIKPVEFETLYEKILRANGSC